MRSPAFAFLLAVLAAFIDAPATLHAQAASSGVVRRPSVELAYVREGSGPPLLVIGSAVCYPRWFPAQLRGRFEMIFADARHFARAFQSTPAEVEALTLDAFVEDVEAVRRELGFEKIAVLGHSIHGQIALAYAQKYPERTSHLVMVGGVPFAFAELASAQQELWARDASPERNGTDAFGADDFSGALPMIHGSFLRRGIPIYEQLANLQGLVGKERLLFVGVPLNMQGGDGMLVRPVVLGY